MPKRQLIWILGLVITGAAVSVGLSVWAVKTFHISTPSGFVILPVILFASLAWRIARTGK